jgi:polyisoprenoid-binding protein YceI
MKKTIICLVFGLLVWSLQAQTGYQVDVNNSSVQWLAKKVTGQHTGVVKIKNGSVQLTGGKLTGGTFELDMNTIKCTDLEPQYAEKLVGHLKSEDFFGVEKYPAAKLTITKVSQGAERGKVRVTGNLTIKAATNPIEFDATVTEKGGVVNANATLVVDRSKYDVRYGSKSFFEGLGDKVIYDDFELTVSLTAKK